jgi:predicted metal-dependent hydrolase
LIAGLPRRRHYNKPAKGRLDMDYEPRYLAGILFFNERDFFESHEVWEALWMECGGPERRFYQGLIQTAVALYHFGNGNVRGAVKLYHSSRNYLEPYGDSYLGLDLAGLRRQMDDCFVEALAAPADSRVPLPEGGVPTIRLDPPPETWPDPAEFVEPDEE